MPGRKDPTRSPVRKARATAVAPARQDDTHTARTSHTMSKTDTVIAHGIDMARLPLCVSLSLLLSPATTQRKKKKKKKKKKKVQRSNSFRAWTSKPGGD